MGMLSLLDTVGVVGVESEEGDLYLALLVGEADGRAQNASTVVIKEDLNFTRAKRFSVPCCDVYFLSEESRNLINATIRNELRSELPRLPLDEQMAIARRRVALIKQLAE